MNELIKVNAAVEYIMAMSEDFRADIALILDGTSINYDSIFDIDYNDIPYFPTPMDDKQYLSCAKIAGKNCFIVNSMPHNYDGFNEIEITRPIRILSGLGVNTIILTSNVASVNIDFEAGELIMIDDHINLSGHNPLSCREAKDFGERFPEMTFAYTHSLKRLTEEVAKEKNIRLNKGVLMSYTGPSRETPAEVKVVKMLGADIIGLSSVYECIAAVQVGMKVLSVGCISNMASGFADCKLCSETVNELCNNQLSLLIQGVVAKI